MPGTTFSKLSRFLVLSAVADLAIAQRQCCSILKQEYPNHVFLPETPGYELETTSYWCDEYIVAPPNCVFTPDSAGLVSGAIRQFEANNCSFAIRSGGHSPSKGWANIDNGVLLATTKLANISSQDGYAFVGSGLRWGAVYDALDADNLVVVGGRGGSVGVAGLVLGGGVSHFTPKRGLACDNVKSFQVVIAGGEILEASADSHPDLFWALKGGQNKFGVVTGFELYTYPSPQLHAIDTRLNMTAFDQVVVEYDQFVRIDSANDGGEDVALGMITFYVPTIGDPFIQLSFISTGANNSNITQKYSRDLSLWPPLAGFENLPFTSVTETTGTMAKLAAGPVEQKLRYDLRTLSFKSSVPMLQGIKQIYEEEFADVFKTVKGFSGVVEFQAVTQSALAQGIAHGGNALGIGNDGAMIVYAMANSWLEADGDQAAHKAGQRVVERGQALAKQLGTYLPFLYANYAAANQDVINSYGAESITKLREVQQKYDPNNILHTLIPGGLSGEQLQG